MRSVYEGVYARSMQDPDGFWAAAAEAIHWEKRWDRVFDDSRPPFYRWFTGGGLNLPHKPLPAGAIELARHKPGRCVALQRPQERPPLVPGGHFGWGAALAGARP